MDIQIENLEIRFEGMPRPLLEIEKRRVASGERLLIRGPSGSGKTSLLHTLTGLLRPVRGDIRLNGRSIPAMGEGALCALRRDQIGFVFQRLNLIDHLTAVENIQLGAPARRISRAEALAQLDKLGMAAHADKLAYTLSLGEQQRVAVARVLAKRPALVIADEPTSALDDASARLVIDALFEVTDKGATLLVASHDLRVAERFSHSWFIEKGALT